MSARSHRQNRDVHRKIPIRQYRRRPGDHPHPRHASPGARAPHPQRGPQRGHQQVTVPHRAGDRRRPQPRPAAHQGDEVREGADALVRGATHPAPRVLPHARQAPEGVRGDARHGARVLQGHEGDQHLRSVGGLHVYGGAEYARARPARGPALTPAPQSLETPELVPRTSSLEILN